jgi:hypothetical protein
MQAVFGAKSFCIKFCVLRKQVFGTKIADRLVAPEGHRNFCTALRPKGISDFSHRSLTPLEANVTEAAWRATKFSQMSLESPKPF